MTPKVQTLGNSGIFPQIPARGDSSFLGTSNSGQNLYSSHAATSKFSNIIIIVVFVSIIERQNHYQKGHFRS